MSALSLSKPTLASGAMLNFAPELSFAVLVCQLMPCIAQSVTSASHSRCRAYRTGDDERKIETSNS